MGDRSRVLAEPSGFGKKTFSFSVIENQSRPGSLIFYIHGGAETNELARTIDTTGDPQTKEHPSFPLEGLDESTKTSGLWRRHDELLRQNDRGRLLADGLYRHRISPRGHCWGYLTIHGRI
jgi:hypothetical protein